MNCPPAPPAPDRRRWWLAVLRTACRFVLAAVFLMAALTKITDLAGFEDRIVLHAGLPSGLDTAVVIILPWLELTCGACLALGYASREAALVTAVMLIGFVAHGLFNLSERDCGCFLFPRIMEAGPSGWHPVRDVLLLMEASPPWWHPVRDVLLLAASILVWSGRPRISAGH
jgi:uncharacterized membrane protein YphA (DoxX/SURF4 family)